MSLWDQGGIEQQYHPDVAKFIAKTRGKSTCQVKEITHGAVTTKCGRVLKGLQEATVWGSEVTCPECSPSQSLL